MKLRTQFNFHKVFVVSAIVIGIGFFLFSLIYSRMMNRSTMEILNQKREGVLGELGQSAVLSSEPTGADIEMAISTFENLDAMESRDGGIKSYGYEANSETLLTDSGDQTPLNHEEGLKKRYFRLTKSPEYKELTCRIMELQLELEAWGDVERPAKDAHIAYMKNPFSVCGLTAAEADEIDWTPEELESVKKEGKRLHQESEVEYANWRAGWDAIKHEWQELEQQRLNVLGMTGAEVLMVLGRR